MQVQILVSPWPIFTCQIYRICRAALRYDGHESTDFAMLVGYGYHMTGPFHSIEKHFVMLSTDANVMCPFVDFHNTLVTSER